ncbi:MAG: MMPL family transporter [Alphaproteobacteria bacterium]
MLSLAVAAFLIFSSLTVKADLSFFLPKTEDPALDLLINRLQNNPQSGLVLMALEGDTDEALVKTSKAFRAALEKDDAFQFVLNDNRAVLGEVQEFLFDNRYLLAPLSKEDFSVEGLKGTLQKAVKSLSGSEGILIKKYLPHDPSLQFFKIIKGFKGHRPPPTKNGVWFSKEDHRALLMLQMNSFSGDIEKQKAALSKVEAIFEELRPSSSMKLLMTGAGVFSAQTGARIKMESMVLSIAATGAVILILLLLLRSFNLFLLVGIPLFAGVLAGIAATQYYFGYIHGITLAFGVTIIGIAIDYPLHLIYHRKKDEPAGQAIKRIWPVLLLGVLTTSLGYSAIIFSHFPGLSQLGIFAIAGLLTSALFTRFILPHFVQDIPPEPKRLQQVLDLKFLHHPLRWVFMVGAGISLLALLIYPKIWEDDIAHLSPVAQESIDLDRSLRGTLGAADVRHMVVVTGTSAQDALEKSELLMVKLDAVVTQGGMAGYEMAAKNMPSIKRQKARQAIIPPKKEIVSHMRKALKTAPFKGKIFNVFLKDIERARLQTPVTIENIPDSILKTKVENFLFQEGLDTDGNPQWIALVLLKDVANPALLAPLNEIESLYYFDFKVSSNTLIQEYQDEAFFWLYLGFGIVCITLFVFLRKQGGIKMVALILLPILMAVICTVATLVFILGVKLSLFHLVALLLVFGIGLDYSLFFTIHSKDSAEDRAETSRAVAVCATTTFTVFAILSLSTVPILRGIGLTVSVGVFMMFLSVLSASAPQGEKK